MSYLRPPMRAYPTVYPRARPRPLLGPSNIQKKHVSHPAAMSGYGGACCSSCAHGGPCAGGGAAMSGLGDDAASVPMTLDQRVASIQQSAADYVRQDAFYKKLQIAAVLLIPLASLVTKTILHVRRGDPIL